VTNNTLIVVMAHKEAQETFDRHLPYWEAHGSPIVVWCPSTALVKTSHEQLGFGTPSHHDAEANRRFKAMCRMCLSKTEYDRFVIFEYDAICVRKDFPWGTDPLEIRGSWFHDKYKTCGGTGWRGHWFCHPPFLIHRPAMEKIVSRQETFPDDIEAGNWDRMFGTAAEEEGLGMYNLRSTVPPVAYTANSFEHGYYHEALAYAKSGAYMFHGIKTPYQLDSILNAMGEAV